MKNNLFEEVIYTKTIVKNNYYKDVFLRIIKSFSFIIPLIVLISIFIIGLIMDIKIDENFYMDIKLNKALITPNSKYLLGTNEFGQDLFYQTFIGAYNTIKLAIVASFFNLLIGTLIGVIWGNNSKFDPFMLLIKNILDNIPSIFFYIIIISALGSGFLPLLIVITIFGWINTAYLIRNNLILLRTNDYNLYSKMNKTPFHKIIINNYLPPLLPIIFNSIAISFPQIIALETTIYYFGLSFSSNSISLGNLLSIAISKNICFTYPHMFFIPLLFIFIINTCVFYIGKTISSNSLKGGTSNDKSQ